MAKLDAMLAGTDAAVIACAHTHTQLLRRHAQRLIVNPSSVDQPLESATRNNWLRYPPWAEVAVQDDAGASLSLILRRVPVDVPALLAQVRARLNPLARIRPFRTAAAARSRSL